MPERSPDGDVVFIVEDERIVAMDMQALLERFGYRVPTLFSSGEALLEHLEALRWGDRRPDLVVMDVRLQGELDGVTAAASVRERFGVPVVLVTAFTDDETLERATMSDPLAYVVKPFGDRQLHSAVALAINRSRMERDVREREELLSKLLAAIPSGVIVGDRDGCVLYANAAARRIVNAPLDVGVTLASVLPAELTAGSVPPRFAQRWNPPENADRTVEVQGAALRAGTSGAASVEGDVDGIPPMTVWVLTDVTERIQHERSTKRKDAQLSYAQRMDAVGRLSGGLAHDFNNLVTAIMGYARLVLDDLDQPGGPETAERIRRNVEGIYDTAHRSAQLTRQLLAFSRAQTLQVEDLEPDALILEIRSMIEGLIPEYVRLVVVRRAASVMVRMNRTRLEQIFLNLLLNARDAMPEGGEVVLSTEVITLEATLPTVSRTLSPGRYVIIRVSDTGHGIPSEHLPHVFEPLFTTKDLGRGSGFGLATVYSAVEDVGGAVDATSTVGRGSVFSVYLPVVEASDVPSGQPTDRDALDDSGSETVLVCHEEEAVRSATARLLRSRGYVPVGARSVGDALLVAERHGAVDLILTDLSAPFLSPAEIVTRFRAVNTCPVVLVVTGQSPTAGQDATLHKPFEPWELLSVVRTVLDRR